MTLTRTDLHHRVADGYGCKKGEATEIVEHFGYMLRIAGDPLMLYNGVLLVAQAVH
jgi:hypothetical protein